MSSPKVLTINDLPNEILLVIFDFAATPPPPNSATRNFRRVVSLTHVSRRWMVTLLGDGQSWSNVHIYGQDIDMLDTQIRRCQQASLRVWVEVPFWSTLKSTHFSQSKKNIEKAANLVRKRRGQVVRLQVRMSCRFFHKLLGNEWPNLKKLVFVDDCSLGSNLHGVVDGGSLPTLKFLSIDGGYGWPVNIATRLTTLRLQGPTNLDLTTFAKFLRRNSSLESLELTGLIIGGSQSYHRGETPIKLPHLNELLVRNATLGCALDLLNLPSLQRLNVSSCARQNPWSDSHWSRLCSQLPITSLEAHYRSSLHQEITVSGSGESGAHSFRFTEFSPTTLGPALFKSLSTTPLSFVTSFTLVKGGAHEPLSERFGPCSIATVERPLGVVPGAEGIGGHGNC
ncbi:hypothetical protein BJ322DRAFT_5105 [Thelephora terrestris]|uniref:F-box domain-containing protein n=1 Tax=Thelephora terrestris TaxID=56493 RepID=A0A9P6LC53_9AGAM|nr:hypothetical protein BJ322DRAFT_5105 [Thelephora terrestris]